MSKQPLQTDCSEGAYEEFEDAFLAYLEWRWELEPLIHYVMAAIQVCHHADRPYPDFVKGFLDWFSEKVVLDEDLLDHKGHDVPRGSLPTLSMNRNPLDAQWRRFEDCRDLLAGWLAGDLKAALEQQESRLELVERPEQPRAAGERSGDTFIDLEVEGLFGERSHTLERRHEKLTKPKHRMGVCIPIALVRRDGAYVLETRTVDEWRRSRLPS
jgi:hypothetical protein